MGSVESLEYLKKIYVRDNDEPLVDVREYAPSIVIKEGISPLVRQQVAIKLGKIAEKLKKERHDLRLLLCQAYRPLVEQKQLWDGYYQELKAARPEWPANILARETNKSFAPYDSPVPPGHATGGAVDVIFIDNDGKPVDMAPPLEDWSLGATDCSMVSESQQEYRRFLLRLMTEEGFSNYPAEYWHYSFGDSAWAARKGKPESLYGVAC